MPANVLATDVERATSLWQQTKGLTFRETLPPDYAMVFPIGGGGFAPIHMLGVKVPLDVLWLRDGEVSQRRTLRPWRGFAIGSADTVVEMPAGGCESVDVADRVMVGDGTVLHEPA